MVTPAEEQPETMTVDEFLAGARARLDRVQPQDLALEMADGALVIDTRDSADREAEAGRATARKPIPDSRVGAGEGKPGSC